VQYGADRLNELITPSKSAHAAERARLVALPMPTPSAGIQAYDKERELALRHDPRRRGNYQRYLAFKRGLSEDRDRTVLDFLPVKLDIENVSRCNFRCRMCQVSDWPKGQRASDMPFEAFRQLLESQYGVVEIKLQGMGEPLMQRDDYFRMIAYARSSHIWVRTTTNASLLHLKDNYRLLIDADPNEVQISIDGADREVFEWIRRGSVFERVIANCKLLNDYCDRKGIVRSKMWVVVQERNQHQLRDFVDLAGKLGFRSLCFSLSLNDWGQQEWRQRNSEMSAEHRITAALCEELMERGRQRGVTVAYWTSAEKFHTRSAKGLCHWPFERLYVSSDLRVVPCCIIGNPEVSDLGDARDLVATWNGPAFQRFRARHASGDIPVECTACYETPGTDQA
jgi:MoaA/NifB/PqqE/SkfB family radical SAM enzyme